MSGLPYNESTPNNPIETIASWDRKPEPDQPGSNERPWLPPGVPPWDSQVHQDLSVQGGWSPPAPRPPAAMPGPLAWATGTVYPGRRSSTVAVWALVTGVIGVLAGWCMFGLPSIAAIALGHVGVSQTKDDQMSGRGMAVAGLILGYVAIIPAIVLTFWMILGSFGAAADPSPGFSPGLTTSP